MPTTNNVLNNIESHYYVFRNCGTHNFTHAKLSFSIKCYYLVPLRINVFTNEIYSFFRKNLKESLKVYLKHVLVQSDEQYVGTSNMKTVTLINRIAV